MSKSPVKYCFARGTDKVFRMVADTSKLVYAELITPEEMIDACSQIQVSSKEFLARTMHKILEEFDDLSLLYECGWFGFGPRLLIDHLSAVRSVTAVDSDDRAIKAAESYVQFTRKAVKGSQWYYKGTTLMQADVLDLDPEWINKTFQVVVNTSVEHFERDQILKHIQTLLLLPNLRYVFLQCSDMPIAEHVWRPSSAEFRRELLAIKPASWTLADYQSLYFPWKETPDIPRNDPTGVFRHTAAFTRNPIAQE